eukprot:gnl/TRDRNA2_/TRDRNA2_128268_c0_seq1.p1 gnl/TRDRNA2_/TRDRNA2_128268_c0~~gnl/TRDRNA2_/TRDRNA2_128268_c0_seq1.p1  ORF type:complete len:209 (+),score=28.67 gnl/TRDRNA2_/TRDRNA2_128268_c0_seq1:66-629(+)
MPGALQLWADYNHALVRVPIRTKCITSCVCFVVSQGLSQLLQQGYVASIKKIFDFGLWGALMPFAAHYWQDFMAFRGPANVFAKIPIDQVLYRMPIMFVFSIYVQLMEGKTFADSWAITLRTNPGLQVTALKLWPAVNVLNFTVVPLRLRVLYQNTVLFFWALYLAIRFSREKKAAEAEKLKDAVKP